jgi:hypothetical protein
LFIILVLGLRSLFFLLAGAVHLFHLLKYGLSVVLIFVGLKMAWLNSLFNGHFPILLSLGIILGVISIIAGLAFIAIWVGLFKDVGAGGYIDCLQRAGEDRAAVQQCSDEFRQSMTNRLGPTS